MSYMYNHDMPISVLVVEDSPGDAKALEQVLHHHDMAENIELRFARRLKQATELMENIRVDAVLLDLSLPDAKGMNGIKKVHSRFPGTPIIVLSGQSGGEIVHDALQNGAQEFLVKGESSGAAIQNAIYQAIFRKYLQEDKEA